MQIPASEFLRRRGITFGAVALAMEVELYLLLLLQGAVGAYEVRSIFAYEFFHLQILGFALVYPVRFLSVMMTGLFGLVNVPRFKMFSIFPFFLFIGFTELNFLFWYSVACPASFPVTIHSSSSWPYLAISWIVMVAAALYYFLRFHPLERRRPSKRKLITVGVFLSWFALYALVLKMPIVNDYCPTSLHAGYSPWNWPWELASGLVIFATLFLLLPTPSRSNRSGTSR
jgi:hypothetical protein